MNVGEMTKALIELEKNQRKKTEDLYRNYRNAGMAISTIIISFTAGLSYFLLNEKLKLMDGPRTFLMTAMAVIIISNFIYQIMQYTGFRFVALANYYYMRSVNSLLSGGAELQANNDTSAMYSKKSDAWFGNADRLFIGVCGCLLGYIFDSGLVYGGYACTFHLSIALLIPMSVGIYFAAKLPT